MDETRTFRRITITLEPQIFSKLPKRDRSAFINLILKQHFQKESFDVLYGMLKKRLMADKDMGEWIEFTVREVR